MKITTEEAAFWHYAKKETDLEISRRFNIPINEIADKIRESNKNTQLIAKFKAWSAIVPKIEKHPIYSNFAKLNDLSFSEQLIEAGIDKRRILRSNENYKLT